jgi:hypothetical protein
MCDKLKHLPHWVRTTRTIVVFMLQAIMLMLALMWADSRGYDRGKMETCQISKMERAGHNIRMAEGQAFFDLTDYKDK